MKHLTSIVALNEEGVIGAKNRLPWRIRSDMEFFKSQTTGNVVIMGRKTFDSLGGKPLPDRLNIVVTHGFKMFAITDACRNAGSIGEALALADQAKKKAQQVFVIGGASMYEQFAPYVDRYLISEIEKLVPDGDTFFDPKLIGPPQNWKIEKLFECKADSHRNEAPFATYELKTRNPVHFETMRNNAISEIRGNKRSERNEYVTFSGLRVCAIR